VSDLPAVGSDPHTEGQRLDRPSAVGLASHTSPVSPPVSVWTSTATRLILAIATGLIIGALTEWSVPHLPFSLEPLGNSAAPWILVTFAVALTSRRTAESLILAVITLLALVSGFYVIEAWRRSNSGLPPA
jgi:hypothetical protein